jgi:hypothetical protein
LGIGLVCHYEFQHVLIDALCAREFEQACFAGGMGGRSNDFDARTQRIAVQHGRRQFFAAPSGNIAASGG